MNPWPKSLGENMFSTARLDPDKPLELRVTTWSNLGSKGGSVTVEGYQATKRVASRLASIEIGSDRTVRAEREHLQDIVDDFNSDLAANWREMVMTARARAAAYYAEKASDYARLAADAADGVFA